MKKPVAPLAGMLIVLLTAPGLADTPTREDRTEVALRTLLTVVHQRIKPEEQHCNLGGIYVRSHDDANPPATVGEVLLSEMSTMVNGQNLVRGSCRGSGRMHCQVRLAIVGSITALAGASTAGAQARLQRRVAPRHPGPDSPGNREHAALEAGDSAAGSAPGG
jgi:hypothetical protein